MSCISKEILLLKGWLNGSELILRSAADTVCCLQLPTFPKHCPMGEHCCPLGSPLVFVYNPIVVILYSTNKRVSVLTLQRDCLAPLRVTDSCSPSCFTAACSVLIVRHSPSIWLARALCLAAPECQRDACSLTMHWDLNSSSIQPLLFFALLTSWISNPRMHRGILVVQDAPRNTRMGEEAVKRQRERELLFHAHSSVSLLEATRNVIRCRSGAAPGPSRNSEIWFIFLCVHQLTYICMF